MDDIARWFASGGGSWIAAATLVVTLVATALSPRDLKLRLRAALVLSALGVLAEVPQRLGAWHPAWAMLRAAGWVLVGCAAARLLVVLALDALLGRIQHHPLTQLRRDVAQAALYVVAALVALRAADVPVTGMVATGTVITAIVGLSLQETLGNLAAGVALQFERTIDLGDWLRLDKGDAQGRVVSMSWRSVVIETDDRTQLVVPNGVFTKTPFTNFSRPGRLTRRSVYVTVPPDVPPVHVLEALCEACRDCELVLADPKPTAMTSEFTDRGVTYWLRFFIADYALRDRVTSEVTTKVWYELHRRKIELAVPRRVVYTHKVNEQYDARLLAEKLKDRRAAVDSVDFLRELSEAARDTLARGGRRLLFAPDEMLLEAGHEGRTFYIVRRGEVAVIENKRELARLGPGQFFGEMALLTGKPRAATIMSVVETEVFEIDEALFSRVLKAEPAVAERIGRIVGERQAEIEARRQGGAQASVEDRTDRSNDVLRGIKRLFGLD